MSWLYVSCSGEFGEFSSKVCANPYRAVSLYCHAWNVAQQQIGYWRTKVPLISKIFALVWPLFIIALVSAPRSPIVGNAAIFFVVSNITRKYPSTEPKAYLTFV